MSIPQCSASDSGQTFDQVSFQAWSPMNPTHSGNVRMAPSTYSTAENRAQVDGWCKSSGASCCLLTTEPAGGPTILQVAIYDEPAAAPTLREAPKVEAKAELSADGRLVTATVGDEKSDKTIQGLIINALKAAKTSGRTFKLPLDEIKIVYTGKEPTLSQEVRDFFIKPFGKNPVAITKTLTISQAK